LDWLVDHRRRAAEASRRVARREKKSAEKKFSTFFLLTISFRASKYAHGSRITIISTRASLAAGGDAMARPSGSMTFLFLQDKRKEVIAMAKKKAAKKPAKKSKKK
jgi:hypothetical protein